ncbi:hypothetical protein ACWKTZ_22310 [Bacillus cereus]|uniref:hypothetical protein n=1 Tax=Bacillus cereus TaxID=1396 RepID=UPI00307A162D
MNIRKAAIGCLLGVMVSGCSTNKEVVKDTPKQTEESNGNKENKEVEKVPDAPKVDENCASVYSKEECEKFTAYYQSSEGKQEDEASKEKSVAKSNGRVTEKEIYEKVEVAVRRVGANSNKIFPAPYESSTVQKRPDGLYYIYSTYEIKGTPKGDGVYEFEMLMSDTFEIKDAYFPGSYGRFSRPMKYDEINDYYRKQAEQRAIEKSKETPEDRERKQKEAEQEEKERQKVMESIYGKDKIIDMDKKTFGEDK